MLSKFLFFLPIFFLVNTAMAMNKLEYANYLDRLPNMIMRAGYNIDEKTAAMNFIESFMNGEFLRSNGLSLAVYMNRADLVELFLAAGDSLYLLNQNKKSALDLALKPFGYEYYSASEKQTNILILQRLKDKSIKHSGF